MTNLADWLIRRFLLSQPGHDETYSGTWLCGVCPYMNVGAICTKCGAPIGQSQQV